MAATYSTWLASLCWCWFLAAFPGTADAGSTISEVDLVFPRNETTYAPSSIFPIVFAFQNFWPARVLEPSIHTRVANYHDENITYSNEWFLDGISFNKSEPYFYTRPFNYFAAEGTWVLSWTLYWRTCNMSADASADEFLYSNMSRRDAIIFTTHNNSSRQVDLVEAINNEQTCSNSPGATLNITDTRAVPDRSKNDMYWGGDTCGSASLPSPSPKPCLVKMNETVASEIYSSITSRECERAKYSATEAAVSCPTEESASYPRSANIWGVVVACAVIQYLLN